MTPDPLLSISTISVFANWLNAEIHPPFIIYTSLGFAFTTFEKPWQMKIAKFTEDVIFVNLAGENCEMLLLILGMICG